MAVYQIKQVFPNDTLEQINKVIKQVPWRYGWASNKSIEFTHWNYDFTDATVENGLDVSDQLQGAIADAWQHLQKEYFGPQTLLRCYTNSHTYGVEGYPHTDSKRLVDQTVVIYMTPEWSRAWGGETVVYDNNNIVHAELPNYNSGIVFPGAQYHCARGVTRICPAQRITLMFKFAPVNADPLRDKIQHFCQTIGADKIKHKSGKLMGHLLRTYDILKSNGHNDVVCAAGAMHSIFGTNAFKHQTLTLEQKDQVLEIIGAEALALVELFHTIKRPRTLETALENNSLTVELNLGGTSTLSQNQLNSICAIEAANLADQKSLKDFPLIKKFLRTVK